nr:MAG TPA: hypothetical protein [Caudoviricetes sp.]
MAILSYRLSTSLESLGMDSSFMDSTMYFITLKRL